MSNANPAVSILITTFNRSRLLRRAIQSVLVQTFGDFEVVIIDDCSPDDTADVVASVKDPRIRYFRNERNVGSVHGDRAHVRRFLNELMRGKYFAYLCDDDYWLPPTLLDRQVALLRDNPGLAFVFGNQLSYNLTTTESYYEGSLDAPITLTWDKIERFFDLKTRQCKSPHMNYFKDLYPKRVMTSDEYLTRFSEEPTTLNRADGGTLFSKQHFIEAGAMRAAVGSQWQAGFEFKMGPASVGGVAFLDEPALVTEIRPHNASFRRTQVEHYLDSVRSIELALAVPIAEAGAARRRFLHHIKAQTIRRLSHAYLLNTTTIRTTGQLGMCGAENIAHAVSFRQVIPVYAHQGVQPTAKCARLLFQAEFTPRSSASAAALLRRAAQRLQPAMAAVLAKGKRAHHGR